MKIWMLCAWGAFGCASSSPDYTPQITVVPGAAARSLWILSKSPSQSPEAGADAAFVEVQPDADAGVPKDER
jgi:hypothetical protein